VANAARLGRGHLGATFGPTTLLPFCTAPTLMRDQPCGDPEGWEDGASVALLPAVRWEASPTIINNGFDIRFQLCS
jgi:hypothetical protein